MKQYLHDKRLLNASHYGVDTKKSCKKKWFFCAPQRGNNYTDLQNKPKSAGTVESIFWGLIGLSLKTSYEAGTYCFGYIFQIKKFFTDIPALNMINICLARLIIMIKLPLKRVSLLLQLGLLLWSDLLYWGGKLLRGKAARITSFFFTGSVFNSAGALLLVDGTGAITLPDLYIVGDPISKMAGLVVVILVLILVQKNAGSRPPRKRPPRKKRDRTKEKLAALDEAERLRRELKENNGRPKGACSCQDNKPIGLIPTLMEKTTSEQRWRWIKKIIQSFL